MIQYFSSKAEDLVFPPPAPQSSQDGFDAIGLALVLGKATGDHSSSWNVLQ